MSRQLLLILCACITLVCVVSCKDTTENESALFFANPRFKGGDYFKTIPIFYPDSVVAHIRAEVPSKWWGLACEGAFFNLPDSVPNAQLFQHLAAYERAFPHDSVHAFAQLMRGRTLISELKYDSALFYLNDCYNISQRDNRPIRAGDAKYYSGQVAMRRGNYPEAVRLFLETHDIYNALPNTGRLFELLMDIGKAYRSNKDYQSAQIWHRKAYTYSYTCCLEELLGYKILSASALAENYLYFNQLDSAQTFIDTAFNIQERIKNYYKEAERYRIRGDIQVARGNYSAALVDFRIAEKRNKTKSNPVVVHRLDKSIAEAYYGLGRIDSALFFYKKALLTPDSTVQVTIMNQLSKIYATQGQYKEALSLEKQSRLLELRLFSIEKEQVLASLTIKKDAEAQMKDAANKIRLTSLGLVTCFILLICALAISWVWVKKNKQEKALAEAREQLKALALTETQAILEQTETQLVFKDTLIKELKLQLLDIKTSSYDSNTPVTATEQLDLRQIKVLTTDDWMRFRTLFDKEYPNLTNRLKEQYPDLSPADVRLFLLTKTGFDPQEIAYIVGIALSSIYKSRHRLRRKLGLIDDDGFDSFIRTF